MKKYDFLAIPFIAILLFAFFPLHANHLDGLWRNDRNQITIRTEQYEDGFRAKRLDQGIWYYYSAEDNRHYVDRQGNWYELIDDDMLVWNEAHGSKRMRFSRIDDRDNHRWNNGNNWDPSWLEDERWNNGRRDNDSWNNGRWNNDDWNQNRNSYQTDFLEGTWYERFGREEMMIQNFSKWIKVRREHGGWDKFYPESRNRFRDKDGNMIILKDSQTLQYIDRHGRDKKIFTRYHYKNRNNRS